MSRLAAIRGDAREHALYGRAAALVTAQGVATDADLERILATPPQAADADVLRQLRVIHETAAWILRESALADLPLDLRWLFESGALTIEQLAVLSMGLGTVTAADLAGAIDEQILRTTAGLGPAAETAIAAALPTLRQALPRIPLGRASAVADRVLSGIRDVQGVAWASAAGSLRRGQDTVGDIELVAAADTPEQALDVVAGMADVTRILHRGRRSVYVRQERLQIGVRVSDVGSAGAALLVATGSHRHVAALRTRARANGWRLTSDGLNLPDGSRHPAASEEEIYSALGLPFIPAELREGGEEFEAARDGSLPSLVSRSDIRGDLHMHTEFSDGRDSVEAMVGTCRALGYAYVAVTDHSPSSAASRNLSVDSLQRQRDDIARLRERWPDIEILHGCEVDILRDGRLDFPDKVLERLDIVLASLHDDGGHAPEQLLRRYLGAMKHPLVTMITHPTNRMLPHKAGYDLDYDRLFAAAVETGTIVEIDGSPAHIDLDSRLARRAAGAGALLAIDSDCHRAELLGQQMNLGITTARRGWIESRHVVNTRPVADIRALIAAKRNR